MYMTNSTRRETSYPGELKIGSRGQGVWRVQEWLNYHNLPTPLNGDFCEATEWSLRRFQPNFDEEPSRELNYAVWIKLIAPMTRALSAISMAHRVDEATLEIAQAHLQERPGEIGGTHWGPWARLYCRGNDGLQRNWCAGFVSFVMAQACFSLQEKKPLASSVWSDGASVRDNESSFFHSSSFPSSSSFPPSALTAEKISLMSFTNSSHPTVVNAPHRRIRAWRQIGECAVELSRKACTEWARPTAEMQAHAVSSTEAPTESYLSTLPHSVS